MLSLATSYFLIVPCDSPKGHGVWVWPARLFLHTLGSSIRKEGTSVPLGITNSMGLAKKQDYLTVNSRDPLDAHVKNEPLLLPLTRNEVPSHGR